MIVTLNLDYIDESTMIYHNVAEIRQNKDTTILLNSQGEEIEEFITEEIQKLHCWDRGGN